MRRIPIRLELAAALLGPLALLLAVTSYEVARSARQARGIRDEVAMAEASVGPAGLFNSLQDERNRAAVDLVGLGASIGLPVADNAAARAVTDRSLEEFTRIVAEGSDAVQDAYAPAFEQLDTLGALRADVDAFRGPFTVIDSVDMADEIFDRYSVIVDALLGANARLVVAIDDPDLRRGADISVLASKQADVVARLIRHVLITAIRPGGFEPREAIVELGRLYGQAVNGEATIHNVATGAYATIAKPVHDAAPPFYDAVAEIFETGQISGAFVASIDTGPDESYDGPFRDKVKAVLDRTADDLEHDSGRRVRAYRLFALVIVAAATLATWWVSRSITRPLRTLTAQATDMAHQSLPAAVLDVLDTPLGNDVVVPELDPIKIRTRDEVADVAVALNTVQDSALGLAVEQAVLRRNIADSFLDLGRRNQNLLGRQIDFITQLEHDASDPEVLANLFRLDHLATRMRRNAESLLVLAGIDPPRKWTAPVPSGWSSGALVFSPPNRAVEVRGHAQPPGYTLVVVDRGVGMSAADLGRANRRLAGAESFTIAPSKYLGHYVAGNLAARHGIQVTLHNSPPDSVGSGRGITATVHLPAEMLGPVAPEPAAPWLDTASVVTVEEL